MTPSELASRIDYTNLEPGATADDIRTLCDAANQYGFAAVCVAAYWVRLTAARLGTNSVVRVCGVVGYPWGVQSASVRGLEARLAVADGATELDIVANLAALRSGNLKAAGDDLAYVIKQARQAADSGVMLKVVLPVGLSEAERAQAAQLAVKAGADYLVLDGGQAMVKPDDVRLLRQASGSLKLKVNGGASLSDALTLLNAGAYRLGSTAGPAIVDEARAMVNND
jgi:deoxyribose-phosphate aldolase